MFSVFLYVSIVRPRRNTGKRVQDDIARVERSMEKIRYFWYQGKHRESLAYSWDEPHGVGGSRKRIQLRARRAIG